MSDFAVTGASGFLGRHIMTAAKTAGAVAHGIPLPRDASVMESGFLDRLISGVNTRVFIHAAAVRNPRNKLEYAFNARLPVLLRDHISIASPDTKFLYISSINAVLDKRTDRYSNSKRESDMKLVKSGAVVVRPSLLWSWHGGGDAGRLAKYLACRFPRHPMVYPGGLYAPLLVNNLAKWLVEKSYEELNGGAHNVWGDRLFTTWELASLLADDNKSKLFPIPTEFFEKLLPDFILKHVPGPLRSISMIPPKRLNTSEKYWVLPFDI